MKIFLKNKLVTSESNSDSKVITRTSRKRDRRFYKRFNILHNELTILNDQEILIANEISLNGFATCVSDSAYQKFSLRNVYDARLAYREEIHDIRIRVAWKNNLVVGFEIESCSESGLKFLNRIVKPMAIAKTMILDHDSLLEVQGTHKMVYTGIDDCEFALWFNRDQELDNWLLSWENRYVEFHRLNGVVTGEQSVKDASLSARGEAFQNNYLRTPDLTIKDETLFFALDILTAMELDAKNIALQTLAR